MFIMELKVVFKTTLNIFILTMSSLDNSSPSSSVVSAEIIAVGGATSLLNYSMFSVCMI